MYLSHLTHKKGAVRKAKKVGRGNGAGHGKTSCRGENGANSRTGAQHKPAFEGGQMPLQRRLPKRGFSNFFSFKYVTVNLGDIAGKLGDSALVDSEFLAKQGLIKSAADSCKILGNGDFNKPVVFKASAFSKSAKEKIEKSGGKAEVI